jgi:hypothetical protein
MFFDLHSFLWVLWFNGERAMRRLGSPLALSIIFLAVTGAFAQWRENPKTGSPQNRLADRTNMAGMVGLMPELKADLVDVHRNAEQKKIVVQADVWGVNLATPQKLTEANNDEAFLGYVLDRNPPIKTDQKEYTFTNVAPGRHTITVQLIAANGQPIGEKTILGVHIPK